MKTRFLLEIFTEEIPHHLQIDAQKDLLINIENILKENNLSFDSIKVYSTPLRLVCEIFGLPNQVEDKIIEKKGPKIDASEDIITSFLTNNAITIDKCTIKDNGKGKFYFYNEVIKGSNLKDFLENIIKNQLLSSIKFKKSMKWDKYALLWARPIRNLCGILQINNEILFLNLAYKGIASSSCIVGNKFLDNKKNVNSIDDYYNFLKENQIVLDSEHRKTLIVNYINDFANKHNVKAHIPNSLLLELSYLVESPVCLQGDIPAKYLVLPSELLISTIVKNQRYIMFLDNNKVFNKFIIISNFSSQDNGIHVIKGNEKVLKARLEDALFFYNNDLKQTLQHKVEDLKSINYFEGLGTLWDKKERVKKLFINIFNENQDILCDIYKADLSTQVVAEFSDLQGIMGYYYATLQGLNIDTAMAIKESYKPQGLNDNLPSTILGAKLSLLDKLDSLISFFSIDKKPTGSKDPFALRRCAIGIIRIILDYKIDINLSKFCMPDVCDFIVDRFISYVESLNIYNIHLIKSSINNQGEINILKFFTQIQNNHQLIQYKNSNDFIKLYKRIDNILHKDLPIDAKSIDYNYTMDESENQLYNILTSFKHTLGEQNFEYLQKLEIFIESTNNFLDSVSIANSSTLEIKTARLLILKNILDLLKVFKDIANIDF